MEKIYRQGDVLLRQIREIPKGMPKKDEILAYGEVTGHKHRLMGSVQVFGKIGEQQFADIEEETELVHEEHDTLKIPKGKYQVIQQREFDVVEGSRQVMD